MDSLVTPMDLSILIIWNFGLLVLLGLTQVWVSRDDHPDLSEALFLGMAVAVGVSYSEMVLKALIVLVGGS